MEKWSFSMCNKFRIIKAIAFNMIGLLKITCYNLMKLIGCEVYGYVC